MDKVFILEHVYEKDDIEEIKFIGVFSTIEKTEAAVEFLRYKPGFQDHPLGCFKIELSTLDFFEWKEGFCNWDEN